jgi:tetratricopeptide (TPR) repeat protein
MKKAIMAGCLVALMAGIAWNLLFAIADLSARRNQADGIRLAMRLMPGNGAYPAQLADQIYAIDPAAAKSLLQRAVRLNRYDASSWIQLGLLCEAADDLPQAEEALLRAAEADSTFLPSWSLANFYFRHPNADRFWYWAQKAARMAPDDATPLFRLAWYVSPNVPEIEGRLQLQRPALEAQFVNFLMSQGDPEPVASAASQLLAGNSKDGTETLLEACDWLIAQKRPELALSLWNGLASRISYAPARVSSPVTNGGFSKAPISHGFDWHLMTVEGVSSFLNVNPNVLGFEFSGSEPDSFTLMNQAAPVQARSAYTLTVDYTTSGIAPGSGIAWLVTDAGTGAELARTASLSSEGGEGNTSACFTAPDGASFVNLSLLYKRQPGTVRVEGKLGLKGVRLSVQDCREGKISPAGAASRESETTLKKQRMEYYRSSTLADEPKESDMPNHEAYKGANRDRQLTIGPLETGVGLLTHPS